MELSNHINLADPTIRRALYETGKWSRIIAIISGIVFALLVLIIIGVSIFASGAMDEAFFDNPMLPQSPAYLMVLYAATVIIGILVSIFLYRFGSALKAGGPTSPLANTKINAAFEHLVILLKCYAVFSGLSLLGNVVMLFL